LAKRVDYKRTLSGLGSPEQGPYKASDCVAGAKSYICHVLRSKKRYDTVTLNEAEIFDTLTSVVSDSTQVSLNGGEIELGWGENCSSFRHEIPATFKRVRLTCVHFPTLYDQDIFA
jgi:hypothetical protein